MQSQTEIQKKAEQDLKTIQKEASVLTNSCVDSETLARLLDNQQKLYDEIKQGDSINQNPNSIYMNLLIRSYLLQQKCEEKDDRMLFSFHFIEKREKEYHETYSVVEYLKKQNQKLQNQVKSLEKQLRSQKRVVRKKCEKNKDLKEDINILRELHQQSFQKQRQKSWYV
jgi:hypothetical protein